MRAIVGKTHSYTILLLLGFVACILLSTNAEEVKRIKGYSYTASNQLPVELSQLVELFKYSISNDDFKTAATLFVKLRKHSNCKYQLEEGYYVSFGKFLYDSFNSIGENGLQVFRKLFDDKALKLLEADSSSSDPQHLLQLLNLYPFSSHFSRASCLIAAEYADRCDYTSALFHS